MGFIESLYGRFRNRQTNESSTRPQSRFSSQQDLGQSLDAVLVSGSQDHRTATYAQSLFQIPAAEIGNISRILEVGFNGRIFLFKEFFAANAQYFGMTLDPDHLKAAQTEAKRSKIQTQILLHDLQQGLPGNWRKMDLAMDIYSASHYYDPYETVRHLAGSLRPGGYCIVVAGGDLTGGLAEFFRQHPEKFPDFSAGPVPRWLYRRIPEPKLSILTRRDEDLQRDAIPDVARRLQESGFNISNPLLEDEVLGCIERVAEIFQADVVCDFDLIFMKKYNTMVEVGLEDVRRFQTNDGTGIIGRLA